MRRVGLLVLVTLAFATLPTPLAAGHDGFPALPTPPLHPSVRAVLPQSMRGGAGPTRAQPTADVAPAPYPSTEAFRLHSRVGASRVLYLDFTGFTLAADSWWRSDGFTAAPFDSDGSPTTWSPGEIATIQSIHLRMAEDYAPFDIDVTTEDPGVAAIDRSSADDDVYGGRVVVTNSPYTSICGSFCAGISNVGNVDLIGPDHERAQPSWVFSDNSQNPEYLANNASHEFGHQMGLSHDGNTSVNGVALEYDIGHGMWAPLMGWGFVQPVSQWSRGEYNGANNTEDDFAVAGSHGIALVPDDAGARWRPTDDLVPGRAQLIGVAPSRDVDAWRYVAPCSGTFTFAADVAAVSPNLSLELRLSDFSGAVLADDSTQPVRVDGDLATGMGGTVTGTLTRGTSYALTVLPLANGTPATGWSNYANVGRYSFAVTPNCVEPSRPVLVPGAFGTSEGNAGRKQFAIPITLSAPATDVVTVRYRAWPVSGIGYATAGVDYLPVRPGTLTFRPGETVKTVNVTVLGDTVKETPLYLGEWFFVRFDSPSANARLDDSSYFSGLGIGIIGDDD